MNRQVRKMYLIKTVKGDITTVTDVQAMDNGIRSIAFPSISMY